MSTYRLTVEYEGTRYHGWQEQKNARSVAGELRGALGRAGAEIIELVGSGRTDAGVHALGQVAHVRLRSAVDAEPLRVATNDHLPPDIHVLSLEAAPERFHARHGAVTRSYLYQISRRRTAFGKPFVWWVKQPLEIGRMEEAAGGLRGRHDFVLFCERPSEQPSTVVVLDEVRVETAGALVLVQLVASHFLWKMARRLVGTLVQVGSGALDPADFRELLVERTGGEKPRFDPARFTAPPSGLFLERVLYPGDPPLPPIRPVLDLRVE